MDTLDIQDIQDRILKHPTRDQELLGILFILCIHVNSEALSCRARPSTAGSRVGVAAIVFLVP